jgi:hypothetical protein
MQHRYTYLLSSFPPSHTTNEHQFLVCHPFSCCCPTYASPSLHAKICASIHFSRPISFMCASLIHSFKCMHGHYSHPHFLFSSMQPCILTLSPTYVHPTILVPHPLSIYSLAKILVAHNPFSLNFSLITPIYNSLLIPSFHSLSFLHLMKCSCSSPSLLHGYHLNSFMQKNK